jgi:hypothetical protein
MKKNTTDSQLAKARHLLMHISNPTILLFIILQVYKIALFNFYYYCEWLCHSEFYRMASLCSLYMKASLCSLFSKKVGL